MSWLFSQALVVGFSEDISSDGEQSARLNGSDTPQAYCAPDKMTGFSRLFRFGMTYKPLTENRGEELLTLFRAGFPVKTLVPQDEVQELQGKSPQCGNTWQELLGRYDPVTHSLKTVQCSLFEDLKPSSVILPRWGSMQDGELYLRQTLVRPIAETEFGLLLPTPDTSNRDNRNVLYDKNAASQSGRSLATYARTWPTPTAHNAGENNAPGEHRRNTPTLTAQVNASMTWPTPRSCSAMAATLTDQGDRFPNLETVVALTDPMLVGGKLNPMWVEWLMGWPLGWTDLKPLVMDKSLSLLQPPSNS
jgi:hypothetical protein